ncbi:MAG TPA: PilC/PilY family type IV pilus protein [Steroidobacteraceae bacterium]|jgi:type IV pilus assembly protein PilY1
MNSSTRLLALIALVLGLAVAPATFAQTLLTEDFTSTTSSATGGVGNWLFFNGACLTAGTSTVLTAPATSIPACTAVLNSYYVNAADGDKYLVGGANGFLGGTSAPASPSLQQPDPDQSGALRFTNGSPFGNQERGAIVSTNAYSTSAGIQVTFKTVTYGGSGADGISFYLMDGCVPVAGAIMPASCASNPIYPTGSPNVPAIGATGGSLAFTCSNTNGPGSGTGVTYDGLTGGYLGLGIDEYGNFLNQGDNTASGYGFQPGRIGLRGGGAISWPALNNAYGTNPGNASLPFYPAWLAATCSAGSFDAATGTCGVCPVIGPTNNTSGGVTTSTATTTTYGNGICTNTTTTTTVTANCNSGYAYNPNATPAVCGSCSSGTYSATSSTSYPSGYCGKAPSRSGTCSSPFALDRTLSLCTTTSSSDLTTRTPLNTGTAGTTTTVSTSTNPPTSQPAYTPNVSAIQAAIQKTCSSGHLWNYATSTPTDAGAATLSNAGNTAKILDYAPIPGAYSILPGSNPLYNGAAATRSAATPIFYNLKITSDGYLSLSYAYNGGAYINVIANQNIQASNGTVPNYVRFGFAGSTGGATNVHEILCFKSAPAVQSASSAGVNEKQSAKVESGTFAYFAYYDQNNWVGRVTANALNSDPTTGNVTVDTTPTWDASCVLTGVLSGQNCSTGVGGPTAAMTPASRVILTYSGGGVPFEWGNLSTAQQAALTQGDANSTQYRFNYLRGDRTDEINSAGTCPDAANTPCFRARTSILGDIVDSSPTWVGPPQSPYTATWRDKLFPTSDPTPENSGTQTYLQFVAAEQTRPNVVYVGSNDGMLHGFRSGSFNADGTFNPANNDGQEVLAYMPGSLLLSPSTGGACASLAATGSIVQNIHGVTPAYTTGGSTQPACVTSALDFSNTQYGHNFFVDATPGTGDLYYSGAWHTWLVGGLGAGGAALFALDVTNPTASNFSEGNASSLVIGEWTPATISCATDSGSTTCNKSLGNTYGTPIIRRLHDGRWAVIFGNGFGSTNGDAGIFVMTIDSSGNKLFYYLSTGNTGTAHNNGIAYVTSADLDGDHITDYVYAGDLMGNLWRFDLTAAAETSWAVSPGPLFTTPAGQPITTAVTVSSGTTPAGGNTVMLAFGTGMRTQFTNAAPVAYQSTTQSLYGVWDWNMSSWNAKSGTPQYASLSATATGLTAPNYTLAQANLQKQTFTLNADGVTRDINNPIAICWAGSTCTTGAQYGWYLNLIGAEEQIVFNPQLLEGVFTVNSVVPANNQVLSCTTNTDTGFTYAISVLTGAAVPNFFVSYHDAAAAGTETNAVGTSFPVTSATGSLWLVSQTVTNQPLLTQVNPGANGKGRRITWVQLR